MTHIDFYILSDDASAARWHFTCRLIEKITRLGNRVLVTLDDPAEARHLDELLWTFKPESFIPHTLLPSEALEQVEITTDLQSEIPLHNHHNVLINLSSVVPAYFSRFERLSEVVIQQPEILKNTREHYSFYRERGYPIQHRKL